MKVTIQEVTIETIAKGKTRYQKANVAYRYNGEARIQTLVSFANPQVFKDIQEVSPGEVIEVDLSKDDKGYTQWTKIVRGGNTPPGSAEAPRSSQQAPRSNFETPEERKFRQLLIVRQSSISNAIDLFKVQGDTDISVEDVLETAQHFVDYVYGGHESLAQVLGDSETVR